MAIPRHVVADAIDRLTRAGFTQVQTEIIADMHREMFLRYRRLVRLQGLAVGCPPDPIERAPSVKKLMAADMSAAQAETLVELINEVRERMKRHHRVVGMQRFGHSPDEPLGLVTIVGPCAAGA